ncbi:MAG TPA: S-methyl-5-thioribose-1-phosphate isomerase [Peptococcaceae bacterium]|nr:MAG: Methylthioribose-1-phosphate isomerase [Clostridia bacterium 41_269]HBT20020.1 S-methyl-5-thioribose-1-phosphate isomerase [Peptococcaceae bacterium]
MQSILWKDTYLELIDQTKLPNSVEYVQCRTYKDVGEAIKTMKVRGAPAIGAAAAFGIVLGSYEVKDASPEKIINHLKKVGDELVFTRPTAVNLKWAVSRMLDRAEKALYSKSDIIKELVNEAVSIYEEDLKINKAIGKHGEKVVPDEAVILTHCNAGSLATVGYGTALGVIRAAKEAGKKVSVVACEARPNFQGARLTTWELLRDGFDVKLIVDSATGYIMKKGLIDLVVVGADRIASNGDTANKIGTYSLAVLAKHHGIPFYVAAPSSTFDLDLKDGTQIPVEERDPEEVRVIGSTRIAPEEVEVINYVFDITPGSLITGIITEYGIIEREKVCEAGSWLKKMKSEVEQ